MLRRVDVFLIAISSPIQIGIYENNALIDSVVTQEKSSDALPIIFEELLKKYKIEKLFFTNGPGSFMAIKIAYVFLKSLSVLKKIPLFATDAFKFNENAPIKAIGKLYFVKISSEIKTQKLEMAPEAEFRLPDALDYKEFNENATPLYMIGAVG